MREIKFRGLRPDNKKWEYGYLLQPNIISNVVRGELAHRDIIVEPETVG